MSLSHLFDSVEKKTLIGSKYLSQLKVRGIISILVASNGHLNSVNMHCILINWKKWGRLLYTAKDDGTIRYLVIEKYIAYPFRWWENLTNKHGSSSSVDVFWALF